jgi:hypothetical protein
MAPLETIQELQENWNMLRPNAKVAKRSSFRYGMLSNLSDLQQLARGYRWLCLACRDEFIEHMDAMTHHCPHEEAFRAYTGRTATGTYAPVKLGRKKGTKNQPKVWNLKALRKSWGVLQSTTMRHSPPKNPKLGVMASGYRYGMIRSLNMTERGKAENKYVCYACRVEFENNKSALAHPCQYEAEFRETTGRRMPTSTDQGTTFADAVATRADYLVSQREPEPTQPRPTPPPVPEPVPAGTPTTLVLEPEGFVRWMHATLVERDKAVAERDHAVAELDTIVTRAAETAKELRIKIHDLQLAQNENQKLRAAQNEPITTKLSVENQQVYGEYLRKPQ